jgi:hypothetical protein
MHALTACDSCCLHLEAIKLILSIQDYVPRACNLFIGIPAIVVFEGTLVDFGLRLKPEFPQYRDFHDINMSI